jgi:hypothetical protein
MDHLVRYGFHIFEDPMAIYMEDFISLKFQPLFHCEFEDQVLDEWPIYFQDFIVLKHFQRV